MELRLDQNVYMGSYRSDLPSKWQRYYCSGVHSTKVILILVSVVPTSFSTDCSRILGTDASLRALEQAVVSFGKTSGRLPTEEEGLEVLVHKPVDWPDEVPWASFLDTTELPRDHWGNRFVYVLTPESANGFGIYSCGQDGVTFLKGNDQDDLNTWNMERPWVARYKRQMWKKDAQSGAITLAIIVLIVATTVGLPRRTVRTGEHS